MSGTRLPHFPRVPAHRSERPTTSARAHFAHAGR
jgi:hypothetical protein